MYDAMCRLAGLGPGGRIGDLGGMEYLEIWGEEKLIFTWLIAQRAFLQIQHSRA